MPTKGWSVDDKGEYAPFLGAVRQELPPDMYEMVQYPSFFGTSYALRPMKVSTDNLILLPGSVTEYINATIDAFCRSGDTYKAMGLVHKRGYLLDGKPGTGKTAVCLLSGQRMKERGGIAVFTSYQAGVAGLTSFLKSIRETHPELFILNVVEDLDRYSRVHEIDALLTLLDGENSIPKVMHLTTTNYLDRLDARFTDRPSRLDEVITVGPPSMQVRAEYLKTILPKGTKTAFVRELAEASKDLTFAHLKELAVACFVYKRDPKMVSTTLREQSTKAGASVVTLSENYTWGDEEDEIVRVVPRVMNTVEAGTVPEPVLDPNIPNGG